MEVQLDAPGEARKNKLIEHVRIYSHIYSHACLADLDIYLCVYVNILCMYKCRGIDIHIYAHLFLLSHIAINLSIYLDF